MKALVFKEQIEKYLSMPTHRKIYLWKKIGYETTFDTNSSLEENDRQFFEWAADHEKKNEFINLMDEATNVAIVHEIDGEIVLDDPAAFGVFLAVNKHNCKSTFDANSERIQHFKNRLKEREASPKDLVIVIINVNDPHGGPIADVLMPNFNWKEIRDRGEIPFARGLANREAMQEAISIFDKDAADKLNSIENDVAIVVIDHNVAEIFT